VHGVSAAVLALGALGAEVELPLHLAFDFLEMPDDSGVPQVPGEAVGFLYKFGLGKHAADAIVINCVIACTARPDDSCHD
jgi:hypothetical protein